MQNSVFEGELTQAQIERVKSGLSKVADLDCDSVLIYAARDRQWLSRESLGVEKGATSNFL